MFATAAAVATLLVGYPLNEDPHGPAQPAGPQALLSATSLKPAESSPEFSAGSVVAVSPDRSRLATMHYQDDTLRFFDRDGRTDGTIPFPQAAGATLMSWLTPERLLVFTCAGYPAGNDVCDRTTVRVVNPVTARIVRTRELPRGVVDASRVRGRAIVVLDNLRRDPDRRAGTFVLDPEGRIVFRYKIAGSLGGDLVSSADSGTGAGSAPAGRIMRIDPRTGETRTRRFKRSPILILPHPGKVDIVQVTRFRFLELDPKTLRTVRAFRTINTVSPTPNGYLERSGSELTARTLSGKRLWSTPLTYAEFAAIGRYVYVQRGLDGGDDPNYRVDVFETRTGEHVAEVPGRYVLTTPGWSSSHASRGPLVDGGYLYYEDD